MADESAVAVVTEYKGPVEIRKVPIPALEAGSTLMKVEAATLCGTDAHRWSGHLTSLGQNSDMPFVYPFDTPFVPGHETCGSVAAANGEIRDIEGKLLREGDRVLSAYSHCGHCYYCEVARQPTLCHQVIGYGYWAPERLLGGCAEYQLVPSGASLIRVPDHVPSPIAASAACALRTVVHSFDQLGPLLPHESVLILGCGPLGLYALAMAVDKGLSNVLLIGAPAARLGIASEWGATKTLDLSTCADVQDRVDWVRSQTGSRGADVVINCASSQALSEAMRMVRPGGRISQIGTSGGAPISIPTHLLFRNITVTMPVMAEARHFYQAIQFVASRAERFDFSKIISGRFPLEGTGEALRRMANLEEVKPLITPHGVH